MRSSVTPGMYSSRPKEPRPFASGPEIVCRGATLNTGCFGFNCRRYALRVERCGDVTVRPCSRTIYCQDNGSSPLVIPRRRRRTHISSDCDHRRKFRFKREPAGRLTTWRASNPDNIWACQNYKDRAAEGSGAHSRGLADMRSCDLRVLGTSRQCAARESDPPLLSDSRLILR